MYRSTLSWPEWQSWVLSILRTAGDTLTFCGIMNVGELGQGYYQCPEGAIADHQGTCGSPLTLRWALILRADGGDPEIGVALGLFRSCFGLLLVVLTAPSGWGQTGVSSWPVPEPWRSRPAPRTHLSFSCPYKNPSSILGPRKLRLQLSPSDPCAPMPTPTGHWKSKGFFQAGPITRGSFSPAMASLGT